MSSSAVEGNATELTERIELLEKTDERIASLYAARSGRDKQEFVALMAQNSGRGRWLAPEEVVEAGLADKVIGGEEGTKRNTLLDRVKGWFSPVGEELPTPPPSDVNILHLPENVLPTTSAIALEEGQALAKCSRTRPQEDPSLEGAASSHNALAYAEDIRNIKCR
jgi:hypothetical protein